MTGSFNSNLPADWNNHTFNVISIRNSLLDGTIPSQMMFRGTSRNPCELDLAFNSLTGGIPKTLQDPYVFFGFLFFPF
jgi:hypothetical protein